MGRRRRRRDEPDRSGVLVVDKPLGPTSHDVVQTVRRAAGQSRVGHTGTLDPGATGVLVVCLGRATKLVRFLQAGTKTYLARMVLGVETDTQDAAGEVVARVPAGHVDERTFCEVLTRFHGDLDQVPPMVSAVKVGGERLHAKARRGEEVERGPRRVRVHDLVLDRYDAVTDPDHPQARFLVTCSPGTYVRTLASDVGRDLGVGASLLELRRVANGPFTEDEAHDPAAVLAASEAGALPGLLLDPVDAVRRVLPTEEVADPDDARRVTQGATLPVRGHAAPVALLHGGLLLAVHADRDGRSRPELVWTRPEELAGGPVGAAPSATPPDPTDRPRPQS